MYNLKNYNFELPKKLIAQEPARVRGKSKLLLMNKNSGLVNHCVFDDFINFLKSTDVLVLNDTKIINSKIFGEKKNGGKVEVLIINFVYFSKHLSERSIILDCILKSSKKVREKSTIYFKNKLKGSIIKYKAGVHTVRFSNGILLKEIIHKFGSLPLPPYIKRKKNTNKKKDKLRYQTVYAKTEGSIASPTAGLHFTKKIIKNIRKIGVKIVSITLHVGYGTFSPIIGNDIRKHKMHSEFFLIKKKTADTINNARNKGHRIFAIGTTTVRALEFIARHQGNTIKETSGSCNLFIYPCYRFKVVNAILTNFHFPKSTLLMLISAFSSRKKILNAYKIAMKKKYFFFSYGDAMLIY